MALKTLGPDTNPIADKHDEGQGAYGDEYKKYGLSREEGRRELQNLAANEDNASNYQDPAENTAIKDQEEQGGGYINNVTGQANPSAKGNWAQRARSIVLDKKKGPATLMIVSLILLAFGGVSFFGLTVAPMAFLANGGLDLDDPASAVNSRAQDQLEKKIFNTKSGSDKVSIGCKSFAGASIPIKCRYKRVSPWLEEKLKSVGVEIEGTKKFGGTLPETYTFTDRSGQKHVYDTPEKFTEAIRGGNPELWREYRKAINMNWLAMKGKTFVNKTLAKYGLSQSPKELTGTADEMTKQLANGKEATPLSEAQFTRIDDVDGDERWQDENGNVYTADAKTDALEGTAPIAESSKPLGQISVSALEKINTGVNIIGSVDAACTVRNLIGSGTTIQKVSNQAQTAVYFMSIAPSVGKLQSGDTLTPEEAEAIQRFFNDTDARETIAGFIAPESGEAEDVTVGEIKNPNYGKSAMDSELYKMSANGGVAHTTDTESSYSLGFGTASFLKSAASKFLGTANLVSDIKNVDGCDFVQSKAVRTAGLLVGGGMLVASVVGCPLTLGLLCPGAGLLVAKTVGTVIVFSAVTAGITRLINAALSQTLITDTMDQAPVERGSALWTGMAAVYSTTSQMRGMMPGSTEDIVAYQKEQNVARQEYIALQREMSDPLDINNPYSIAGSITYSLYDRLPTSTSNSLASLPVNLSSFVFGGLLSATAPSSANAAAINPERFEQCDDAEYKEIGINADVQCNVRYVMPEESMQWDSIEAAQEMEDRKFVESDTTTGYPKGYTAPEPSKVQEGAMNVIKGSVKDFGKDFVQGIYGVSESYEDKYNKAYEDEGLKGAKYAKFLDYCVYRALPYGNTYEEGGAWGDIEADWLDGKMCRNTEDEDINLFRIYVFDITVDDDLEGPVVGDVNCGPFNSSTATGGANDPADVAKIDAAIKVSQDNNPNNPHPLDGKGQQIVDLSNQYGVNARFIATTLLAETQFGADGTSGPANNNFGYNKLNDANECKAFYVGIDAYNCYNTPEKGIEGILKNLTTNPTYKEGTGPGGEASGTVAAVRNIYCPEGDGNCSLDGFIEDSKEIDLPLNKDDPVFITAGSGGGSSSGGTAGAGTKMSQTELSQQLASYGLPAPKADNSPELEVYGDQVKGYTELAQQLKGDPKAAWAAQAMLNGEKKWKAAGGDVKEYLNTAWLWFETGQSAWPDPYEMNCVNDSSVEATHPCTSANFQAAGYQPNDVDDKFKEVYDKLYQEGDLASVMQEVIQNSSNASVPAWNYNDSSNSGRASYFSDLSSIKFDDLWPNKSFLDEKAQIQSLILGKDPNMAAALNSFAISDDDLIKALQGGGYGYIDAPEKQQLSNMMMALYTFDGAGPSGSANCDRGAAGSGSGVGISAVWGGGPEVTMDDLSYGYKSVPTGGAQPGWYDYGAKHGLSGSEHTGTDIPMAAYAPVYSPVEGIVLCERNGVGEGVNEVGCAGSGDLSGTGGKCSENGYDATKPKGAGTILIKITKNGSPTGEYLRLGHLSDSLVKVGDTIKPNQHVGSVGCMNGWHVHVEYFIPTPPGEKTVSGLKLVDPVEYLGGGGSNG